MDNGVEIFVTPGRQINERHAAIDRFGMMLPAVDSDLMATLDEPYG